MTSFVQEILSAGGKLDSKEDFAGKASRLQKRIDEAKAGLRAHVETKYIDFSTTFSTTASVVSNLESSVSEVNALRTAINAYLRPEMTSATAELAELSKQLLEMSATVTIANRIKKAFLDMEEANALMDESKYFEAVSKLRSVQLCVKGDLEDSELENRDSDQVRALKAIEQESIAALEKIEIVFAKEWDRRIVITDSIDETLCGNNDDISEEELCYIKESQINLDSDSDPNAPPLQDLILAMHKIDMLSYHLGRFGLKLMESVLKPIIKQQLSVRVEENRCFLQAQNNHKAKPMPQEVLLHLEVIFKLLRNIFNVVIDTDSLDGDRATVLQLLGESFGDSFALFLVQECLLPAVPVDRSKLPDFGTVAQGVNSLSELLLQCTFFRDEQDQAYVRLKAFTYNIDSTFADRCTANILERAREQMKKSLHEAREVTSMEKFSDETGYAEEDIAKLEHLHIPEDIPLQESLYEFPRCLVSEHVFSVLQIVKETIEEASAVGNDMTFCGNDTFVGSGGGGGQLPLELTDVVRSVMEMYCDVLVNYHKDTLRQLPQHAAFALTNTMYLSHACLILILEAKARLPKEVVSQGLSLADLVAKLRAVGVAVFQDQMRLQRDQLKAIIGEIELASCSGEAHLPPQAEKCLKQVLHQLNHLQGVWSSVLPQSVYCRSIGIILNSVVEELVAKVLALEDIAADSATEISSLLSLLEDRAPQVYEEREVQKSPSRHMVNKYVKSWQKLKQLIFVLNAGLKEIEERWADGKGPLASEFSAEDMKHVIRALFQNTDRRAAVLAKIRYE